MSTIQESTEELGRCDFELLVQRNDFHVFDTQF